MKINNNRVRRPEHFQDGRHVGICDCNFARNSRRYRTCQKQRKHASVSSNFQSSHHPWFRYFVSFTVNTTPVRHEETNLLTSTYDNCIRTTGIGDGVSHSVKILSVFYNNLHTTDPNDPEVIIKIDIFNVFNTTCRVLTLDVLSGHTSRDYGCVLK